MDELRGLAGREYMAPFQIAVGHVGLGNRDSGFRWLDRAYDERDPSMGEGISSLIWDPVRTGPRYGRLLARLGLPR